MCRKTRLIPRALTLAVFLFGMILAALPSVAGIVGKVAIDMKAAVPPQSAVRVGYVDYGYPEIPSDELVFATAPFSQFQRGMLLALANQEGLLFHIVGAAEESAYAHFLDNLRERERLNKSQNEYEFGSSKPSMVVKYESYDLRSLIDADVWSGCAYEVRIKLEDWDYQEISTETSWNKQYWSLDTWVESANLTLSFAEIETGNTMFSVYYQMTGEDLQEMFDEVAADFTSRLEVALWKKWVER